MFNITKALKKLIECSIGDGKKHCNGYVTFAELNAIFESGQDDEFDLLEFQRGYFSGHKDAMKDIEERLTRLEKRMNNADPVGGLFGEPEKPVTEENCNCSDAEEPHIHHIPNDDKPSECEHNFIDYGKGFSGKICTKCGVSLSQFVSDKNNDTIRISRKVAEEWRKRHTYTDSLKDIVASRFESEIRNALEG